MKTCEFRRDSYIYIIIFLISQSMKTLVSIPNITVNIIEVTRNPFCNNQDWISFFHFKTRYKHIYICFAQPPPCNSNGALKI